MDSLKLKPEQIYFLLYLESASLYMLQLRKLIETTFEENGNKKVVLFAHSMGAPYTLYFLRAASKEWKDKFIKSFVTVSGIIFFSFSLIHNSILTITYVRNVTE